MNKLLLGMLLIIILINPLIALKMLGESNQNQNQETIISGENRRD